jgi:hypothetical protein
MPREAVDLANERDCLRKLNPQNPEVQRLNLIISDIINREAKATWIKNVEDSHPRDSPEKHWRLLKMLSGKRAYQPPNQPITLSNKNFSRPLAIANRFCKQFSSVKPHKSNKRSCRINRGLKKKHHLETSFCPFTDVLTKGAIQKSSNSAAFGPDGLTALHLKALGPLAIKYLTTLYNLSVAHANIPSIWHLAKG